MLLTHTKIYTRNGSVCRVLSQTIKHAPAVSSAAAACSSGGGLRTFKKNRSPVTHGGRVGRGVGARLVGAAVGARVGWVVGPAVAVGA